MKRTRTYLVATLALLASGCGSSQGSGKVTLLLKDAPAADVRAAVVTIAQVALAGDSGVVVLRDTPVTTNLLTLSNDVMTLVDAATVPAGTYGQLRFVITGGYLDVGGTIYASSPDYEGLPVGAIVGGELQMPSYDRSGLKVVLPGGGLVIGDPPQTWLLDFDVSQSFGHGTGTDKWVMHPVVKATPIEQTGSVAVTLTVHSEASLPESVSVDMFQATLTPAAGGDVVVLPLDDLDGDATFSATFQYLAAGDYLVSFQAPPVVTMFDVAPAIPATATVAGGATVTLDFLLTGADASVPDL